MNRIKNRPLVVEPSRESTASPWVTEPRFVRQSASSKVVGGRYDLIAKRVSNAQGNFS
ncbi:MAG: hypothetical protein ACREQA_24215 [Candidatus Binatia bacterium]